MRQVNDTGMIDIQVKCKFRLEFIIWALLYLLGLLTNFTSFQNSHKKREAAKASLFFAFIFENYLKIPARIFIVGHHHRPVHQMG